MFSFVYVAAKTKTANTAYKGSPTQTPPLTIRDARRFGLGFAWKELKTHKIIHDSFIG